MNAVFAILRRDLRLFAARGSDAVATLFFFLVVVSLFPFALSSEAGLLQKAAPGILWVGAVLAGLLSLENIHLRDYEDGTLDLLMMSPLPPWRLAAAKMLAHWLLSGLLLVPAAVLAAFMLGLGGGAALVAAATLALGTIYMSLLGGIGAALTFGSRRSGLLLAVLVLPLFIPMLILGVMGLEAALADLPYKAYLLLQLALVVPALPIAPAVAAAFFKMHLRSN
ncbi:MAG: heme exporter protein CcmB [Micavibrio sp.]|nr:heme exporter protein CcmB [Micavibrio sp.]